MEQCSETSAYKIQTPGNYPEESIQGIHDVTTIWKRNVCSLIRILHVFDVRLTRDTADVQPILPFPPNPLKHVLCDVPARWQYRLQDHSKCYVHCV